MQGGVVYEHQTLVQATDEIDGGYLPTPTICGNHNRKGASATSGDGLVTALLKKQQFPTPNTFQGNNTGRLDELGGKGNKFRKTEDGKQLLNPLFVEELMGFPIDYTALKDWVTPKSRCKQQSPGNCSEVSK
jgi:DNA (cytosine-5)-methyltransferase 1